MSKESVVLTPNRRLARYLQSQSRSTSTKRILPIATWLANCWLEFSQDTRILLSSHQERWLWLKVIEEVLGKKFDNIVVYILEANELLINWQLKSIDWFNYEYEDVVIFKKINERFVQYCKNKNFVIVCQLPFLIQSYVQKLGLKLILSDFDEYPPQLKAFIYNLQKNNCEIIHCNSNNYKNSLLQKISFNNQQDEIITIANWAKKIICNNPDANIGVVVTNLPEIRSEIMRIFSGVFDDVKNINISAGIIFNSLPIIICALDLLALQWPFNLKTLSKILLSPYICGAETEKSNRALFDFYLCKASQAKFNLTVIEFLAKKHSINISLLITILQKTQDIFLQIKNKKLFATDWAKIFAQILQVFGWPGENNLDEHEYMAVERFTELLNEVTTADIVLEKISYKKALEILIDLAKHTIFQLKQETNSKINVLGVLEAAGINFDYLWVMGMNQEYWPQTPEPNPFIPIKIQKQFGLPHSSAERELYFCEKLIQRIKQSAPEVIFSYVKQIEDQAVEPSVLIEDIPEILINDLNLVDDLLPAKKIFFSKKTDFFADTTFLTLMPNESINGGIRLLESQSLCPFKAFAEFRLNANELKQYEFGISKLMRGTLIHAALENFWQEIKTQQNLLSLDQKSLQSIITKCVTSVCDKIDLSNQLQPFEQKCLIRLLNCWLKVEKSRIPFQVIETEKIIQAVLGPVQIKLRIDRIDKLSDGSFLVIDYKTGKNLPTIFDWFGKRPKNPQLPFYCVAVNEVRGFAFAQINIESIKFKEIGLDELAFGLRTVDENNFKNNLNWQELIAYWQEILTDLAKNFVQGYAKPEPLSLQICKECEFRILCRY